MQYKLNNSFKLSFDIIGLLIYIVVYIILLIFQKSLSGYGENGVVFQGISGQLQLLLSAFVVIAFPDRGYKTAVVINAVSSIRLLIALASHKDKMAVTGFISTLATIILITIIYFFYQRIIRNNRELQRANLNLKEKDEKLTYLAYYDILTGLPNRQLFIERIDEAINLIEPVPFTVIACNIDNFKIVNNEYGNNAGDAVLCSFAKKLKHFCGNSMFLARINGDEFGMIVYGKESESTVINYIEAIREIAAEPISLGDSRINVTMSFGAAAYPQNASASTEILKCVNSALTYSKNTGKNKHCFYKNISDFDNK